MTLNTKEERLAKRFSQKRNLSVPFDVEVLAKSLADLQEKTFPDELDGICIDVKGRNGKPRIWIQKGLRPRRRNFTLAHEIGHIVIPWHTGSIVDDLDIDGSYESSFYFDMEKEANRFAAELLMPKEWACSLIDRAEHMQNAMRAIYDIAKVSAQAAALRVIQLGPPGYVMSATRDGAITWSQKTAGTTTRLPLRGEFITNVQMHTHHDPLLLQIGRTVYYWWKERDSIEVPPNPEVVWRDVLDEIVSDVAAPEPHKIKQRIKAIIGLSVRTHPRGSKVEAMYWSVLSNLENRNDHDPWLSAALAHSRFQHYVLGRLYERNAQTP